jgi:hypothetical protein
MIDNVAIINIGDHSIGISAQTGGCVSKNWTVQNSYIHQVTQNPTLNSVAIAMGGIAPPADFQNIHISNNIILNSYVQVNGTNIHVTNNDISGWAFGTGIYQVEFTSKYHVITGNILHDSATTYDANGTPSGGIDLDGEHSIAANNICYNLGGWCIQVFGGYNLVSGNHSQNTNLAIPQNDRTRAPYQIVSNSGVGLISTGNLIQNNRDLGGAAQLYSFFERDAFGVDNVVKDNIFPLPVSLKNGTTTFIPGDADTVLLDATSNQTGLLSNTAYKPVGASLSAVSEIVAAPTLGAGP